MTRSTTLLHTLLAAGALLLPVAAGAQSPRKVLIEEATNASCGPCAAQNPTFEAYLARPDNRDLISIVFHSAFPGADVMNAANATMHNGRVSFYSISGVPSALVNGIHPTATFSGGYDGAPSDTIAIAHDVNAVRGTTSPITMTVTSTLDGGAVNGSVKISTIAALSGKRVFVVAVEAHHNYAKAGTNGEKDFYYIARKMLAGDNGAAVTLAAGESMNVPVSYTPDATWDANGMYIVAFVQDPTTKEVLQVETDRTIIKATTPTGMFSAIRKMPAGETFGAELTTSRDGMYTVKVTKSLPAGWTADVKVGDSTIGATGTAMLKSGTSAPLNVSFATANSTSKSGKGSVTVSYSGPGGADWSQKFTLYADNIQALVITRDEGLATISTSYDAALAKGDVIYAIVDHGDEGLFDLHTYPAVVYEVGKGALRASDIAELKDFFTRGGRLFLIGAEIGYGLADPANTDEATPHDEAFMNTYLHATYVRDSNLSTPVKGVAGDPVGDGLSFRINNGVQNEDTPDELAPRDGAVPILYYGSSQGVAGIRYSDAQNRLVYLGFGAEGIGDINQRSLLLKKGIAWLMGPAGVDGGDAAASGMSLGQARPNPASGIAMLSYSINRASHLAADLYNLRGEHVATLADRDAEAGEGMIRIDGAMLPAGVYTAVVNVGGAHITRQVTIVH
ncbi:MAG: hypothetical protein JWQ98_1430 [Chlorobi bacterium]|nr:hypothetical protein [Chlorobiota bacterium]